MRTLQWFLRPLWVPLPSQPEPPHALSLSPPSSAALTPMIRSAPRSASHSLSVALWHLHLLRSSQRICGTSIFPAVRVDPEDSLWIDKANQVSINSTGRKFVCCWCCSFQICDDFNLEGPSVLPHFEFLLMSFSYVKTSHFLGSLFHSVSERKLFLLLCLMLLFCCCCFF